VKSVNVIDVMDGFIVEYLFSSYSVRELMPVLVNLFMEVPRDDPRVESICDVFPSADYLEREMHDLFGVIFEGNPWMGKRFLLAPDSPENPLRKDFVIEEEVYIGD